MASAPLSPTQEVTPFLLFESAGMDLPGHPVTPRPLKVTAFSKNSWLLRPQDEADEQGNRAPRPACPFLRGLMNTQVLTAPQHLDTWLTQGATVWVYFPSK